MAVTEDVLYFDPELSYELTGYRPINETQGLDFDPTPFNELCEAMLYIAGASDRLGRVADGNTVLDFDSEEKRRKSSVSSACLLYTSIRLRRNRRSIPHPKSPL